MTKRNPDLLEALRATLKQLEDDADTANDLNLLKLKRHILLTLADLEQEPDDEAESAAA